MRNQFNNKIFFSPLKVNGDYENYRSWFLYQEPIHSATVRSLVVDEGEELQSNVINFDTIDALEGYMAKEANNMSLAYPTKDGGFRVIIAKRETGDTVSGLEKVLGIKPTYAGLTNRIKYTKRIKRIFRQTRYGFFFPGTYGEAMGSSVGTYDEPTVEYMEDPKSHWDGMGLISSQFLDSLGIRNNPGDRFSGTFLWKDKGGYKDHLISDDRIKSDLFLFNTPSKEFTYSGKTFLQLDPVKTEGTVRMDLQTMTGMMMAGVNIIEPSQLFHMIEEGLKTLENKMLEPIDPNNNVDANNKISKMGLHELAWLPPRAVAMRWNSEKKSLINFHKMKFPTNAIKAYAAPLYTVENGVPRLLDGDCPVYKNGNIHFPLSLIDQIKKDHGGCDWDDGMNILPLSDGTFAVWRSPNKYDELRVYHVKF